MDIRAPRRTSPSLVRHLVALLVGPPQALQEFDICGDDPVERRGDGSWLAITARENAFPPEVERLCHMKPGRARVDRRERSRSRVARGMGRADRDDQGRAVNLIASEPDGGDRRAGSSTTRIDHSASGQKSPPASFSFSPMNTTAASRHREIIELKVKRVSEFSPCETGRSPG
jgi:hypothetical protein